MENNTQRIQSEFGPESNENTFEDNPVFIVGDDPIAIKDNVIDALYDLKPGQLLCFPYFHKRQEGHIPNDLTETILTIQEMHRRQNVETPLTVLFQLAMIATSSASKFERFRKTLGYKPEPSNIGDSFEIRTLNRDSKNIDLVNPQTGEVTQSPRIVFEQSVSSHGILNDILNPHSSIYGRTQRRFTSTEGADTVLQSQFEALFKVIPGSEEKIFYNLLEDIDSYINQNNQHTLGVNILPIPVGKEFFSIVESHSSIDRQVASKTIEKVRSLTTFVNSFDRLCASYLKFTVKQKSMFQNLFYKLQILKKGQPDVSWCTKASKSALGLYALRTETGNVLPITSGVAEVESTYNVSDSQIRVSNKYLVIDLLYRVYSQLNSNNITQQTNNVRDTALITSQAKFGLLVQEHSEDLSSIYELVDQIRQNNKAASIASILVKMQFNVSSSTQETKEKKSRKRRRK